MNKQVKLAAEIDAGYEIETYDVVSYLYFFESLNFELLT